ncbi:MAG: hypothetical protein SH857_03910 [Chitinophagales bacterium]|nr:hypothetical protein [Chitinophagales bacterium]
MNGLRRANPALIIATATCSVGGEGKDFRKKSYSRQGIMTG